jgi:antitoxin Phd
MEEWRLADAKNRFSEVVNHALAGEPQIVRRRHEAVVVLSQAEYDRLRGVKGSFKQHLLSPPYPFSLPDSLRDRSPMRDVEL